jgi:tRNA threonylcarbamoyladenosine biosynthesis protein TsaE
VDLYRLERAEELVELGLEEIVAGEGVCAIEWVDRFAGVAGSDWLEVRIGFAPKDARTVEIVPHGTRAQALAHQWDKQRH